LAPSDAGYCGEVKDSVFPVNDLSNCLVVSNISPDFFAVDKPGVRVEF
jgi:hypothetical protein